MSADTEGALRAKKVPSSGGAAKVGAQGGDPRAARDIAAANNQESLRFPSGDSFVVGDSVKLAPPVTFASGGAGGGIGAGIGGGIGLGGGISGGISGGAGLSLGGGISGGLGVSGGIGGGLSGGVSGGLSSGLSVGASAGFSGGISGGASFTAGASAGGGAVFGAKASARVTASAGAFAGLRLPAPERRFDRLRLDRLQPRPESVSLGTDRDASFQLGGQASLQGSASLRADVTGSARLGARIRFDGD